MKNALAWVAVLCLVGSAAVADSFNATKDNSVLGHSSEIYMNTGAYPNSRIAKTYQHQMILDFDTAAMKAFQTANPLGVGEYYKYELFLHVRRDWGAAPKAVQIRTLNVDDDWAEGDGMWNIFDWSAGTAASIYQYAQGRYTDVDGLPGTGDEVLDTANSIPWKDENGVAASNLRLLPYSYQNAVDFAASSADHGTYVGVVLDDDLDPLNTNLLVNDLLNNPKNRGLRTWKNDWINEKVDFREQDGGIYAPYLEVTVGRAPVTVGPGGDTAVSASVR